MLSYLWQKSRNPQLCEFTSCIGLSYPKGGFLVIEMGAGKTRLYLTRSAEAAWAGEIGTVRAVSTNADMLRLIVNYVSRASANSSVLIRDVLAALRMQLPASPARETKHRAISSGNCISERSMGRWPHCRPRLSVQGRRTRNPAHMTRTFRWRRVAMARSGLPSYHLPIPRYRSLSAIQDKGDEKEGTDNQVP